MSVIKTLKTTAKNSAVTIMLILVLCGMAAMVLEASAHAVSLRYFATSPTAGTPCDLPDGSTGGVIGNDLQTCCPLATTNGPPSYAISPVACLYGKYINPVVRLLSALIGVVVVIAIIYGAIEYITSDGDPKRIASAKQRITNALLGLVAFMLFYAFLQFIIPSGVLNG